MVVLLQMGSFFVEQGTQMDRKMFGGKIQIPAASLALFNTISIIALIPVYDRILVPGLRYFGKKISLLQRIGRDSASHMQQTVCLHKVMFAEGLLLCIGLPA